MTFDLQVGISEKSFSYDGPRFSYSTYPTRLGESMHRWHWNIEILHDSEFSIQDRTWPRSDGCGTFLRCPSESKSKTGNSKSEAELLLFSLSYKSTSRCANSIFIPSHLPLEYSFTSSLFHHEVLGYHFFSRCVDRTRSSSGSGRRWRQYWWLVWGSSPSTTHTPNPSPLGTMYDLFSASVTE